MTETTALLNICLDRLKNGDQRARDELVARASRRLAALAERMLRDYPRVARWEHSDDLFQRAAMRLHRSLTEIVPSTAEEFFRLAALQLRRELKDMARHYFGPEGLGANHSKSTPKSKRSVALSRAFDPHDSSSDPHKLALWTEFHSAVEKLPEIEKRVFDLLWYHELSQVQAAEILQVTDRQLRRYWQSARLKLQEFMGESGRVW